jgi:hypothetical protein
MKKHIIIAGALALTAITTAHAQPGGQPPPPPPQLGASALDYLVYCAGDKSGVIADAVKNDITKECNVNRGTKDYCSLLEGSPWDCATPEATAAPQPPPPPDPTKPKFCAYQNIEISFEVGVKLPAGWTAKTGGKISFGVSVDKTPKGSCTPKPRDPMPAEGNGGKYVSENGTLFAEVEFTVEGELSLTSPQGFGVTLKGKGKCGRGVTIDYFKEAEVNLCPCKKKTVMSATGEIEVCDTETTDEEGDTGGGGSELPGPIATDVNQVGDAP